MAVEFHGNKVFNGNNMLIGSVNGQIEKLIGYKGCVLILLEDEAGKDRNVVCLNCLGQLLWQIEAPHKLHAGNRFTSIYVQENHLYAYSVSGIENAVDIESGRF